MQVGRTEIRLSPATWIACKTPWATLPSQLHKEACVCSPWLAKVCMSFCRVPDLHGNFLQTTGGQQQPWKGLVWGTKRLLLGNVGALMEMPTSPGQTMSCFQSNESAMMKSHWKECDLTLVTTHLSPGIQLCWVITTFFWLQPSQYECSWGPLLSIICCAVVTTEKLLKISSPPPLDLLPYSAAAEFSVFLSWF